MHTTNIRWTGLEHLGTFSACTMVHIPFVGSFIATKERRITLKKCTITIVIMKFITTIVELQWFPLRHRYSTERERARENEVFFSFSWKVVNVSILIDRISNFIYLRSEWNYKYTGAHAHTKKVSVTYQPFIMLAIFLCALLLQLSSSFIVLVSSSYSLCATVFFPWRFVCLPLGWPCY